MINFPRSSFTWKAHPWKPDPYYKWPGGFVGEHGQVYHVRFTLEARCVLRDSGGAELAELFLGAPCRSEYTIASENLFQIPSGEWRMPFSRSSIPTSAIAPASRARSPRKSVRVRWRMRIRITLSISAPIRHPRLEEVDALEDVDAIVASTFAGDAQNARSVYQDEASGIEVELEYPINVMNLNVDDGQYQVCTGPGTATGSGDLGWKRAMYIGCSSPMRPSRAATGWSLFCGVRCKPRPRSGRGSMQASGPRSAGIASIPIIHPPAIRPNGLSRWCTTRFGIWPRTTQCCGPIDFDLQRRLLMYRAAVIGLGWMGLLYDLAPRIGDRFEIDFIDDPAHAAVGHPSQISPLRPPTRLTRAIPPRHPARGITCGIGPRWTRSIASDRDRQAAESLCESAMGLRRSTRTPRPCCERSECLRSRSISLSTNTKYRAHFTLLFLFLHYLKYRRSFNPYSCQLSLKDCSLRVHTLELIEWSRWWVPALRPRCLCVAGRLPRRILRLREPRRCSQKG